MHIVSEEKEITGVTKVILREYGQLYVFQGPEETLKIEGQDGLTRMVRTEVRNGELIIDIDGGWWDRTWRALSSTVEGKPLKYYLTLKKLEGLFVSGAARVTAKDLQLEDIQIVLKGAGEVILSNLTANKLDVEFPGAGIISVSGKVVEQNVFMRGAGSYDAPRLESQKTNVKLNGVGHASVWATHELNASVDGVGKIDYYGSPEVRRNVNGLGKISQKGYH
jgi:hypothetical protein